MNDELNDVVPHIMRSERGIGLEFEESRCGKEGTGKGE